MTTYYLTKDELYHHGILGQKWGVRRYQNEDGTYTAEGKARRNNHDDSYYTVGGKKISKSTVKKVVKTAGVLGTTGAVALYVKKHPETIAKVISKAKNINIKNIASNTIDKGKKSVKKALKDAGKQAVQGAKDGIREAPYKVAKVAMGGAAIMAANKLVEQLIGKEENSKLIKAYNAYNKKNKIGQVPNMFGSNTKDDEDE